MKVVFLDRDGTLIVEPLDAQVDSLEKLQLVPGVIGGLRLLIDRGYALVMVTNQDNLVTTRFSQQSFDQPQQKLLQIFEGEGIRFSQIYICPHTLEDRCECRKPKTGLVDGFLSQNQIDRLKSFVVGDRETDVQFGKAIGCKTIHLTGDKSSQADYVTPSFMSACSYIVRVDRSARHERLTSETQSVVEVVLDGTGSSAITTGIGFFDHMLAQLAKHSMIDMTISVKGDLHVDAHHTVEDAGLALGEAIRQALGDKRGIERYGFLLPMDESLAQIALDLGGRPLLVFEASFDHEKIGELPTDLVEDFFRAFADGLRANLHITVEGRNDHHKVEAIFKAVARALKQAVALDRRHLDAIPSTKGML